MPAAETVVPETSSVRKAWSAVSALSLCVTTLIASELLPVSLLTRIAAPLGSFLGHYIGWRGAFFMVVPLAAKLLIGAGLVAALGVRPALTTKEIADAT